MSIEVLNESGDDVDIGQVSRLARFVMDQMRVHPLAELDALIADNHDSKTLIALLKLKDRLAKR